MSKTTTVTMAARTVASGALELLIYDQVGEGFFSEGITAKSVRAQIAEAGHVSEINVRLNSVGGITNEGFAIYNILREHPATVTTYVDGDAMSIASIIALAGDRRVMAPNARMMIHEAKAVPGRALGKKELASLLEAIDQTNEALVDTYVKHTGQTAEQIAEWMAAETYMGSKLAKERGFIDEISGEEAEEARIAAWGGLSAQMTTPTEGRGESMADLKTIALAAGLGEDAGNDAIVARFGELANAAAEGKAAATERDDLVLALGCDNVEAAKGVAIAAKQAVEANKTLEQRVEAMERAQTEAKRQNILASIKASGKSTPALEQKVFPGMSIDALQAFAESAPRIVGKSEHSEPTNQDTGKTDGDTFAAMKPAARAALKRENADEYNRLRAAAQVANLI